MVHGGFAQWLQCLSLVIFSRLCSSLDRARVEKFEKTVVTSRIVSLVLQLELLPSNH